MLRIIIAACLSVAFGSVAVHAREMTSVYTRLDHQRDCETISSTNTGNRDLVCPGPGQYSYTLRVTDGRESATYGFASQPGMPTFANFNYANGTVEWRLAAGGRPKPTAAIQRWFLADGNGDWAFQILVVSKVGQPRDMDACVVGYIDARDGANANVRARAIADEAATFECGRDTPRVERGISRLVPPA